MAWNKFQLLTVINCAADGPGEAVGRLCQHGESSHKSRCSIADNYYV